MNLNKYLDFNKTGSFKIKIVIFISASILIFGCEGFVEVDPPRTSLVGETVFEDDINAKAAMVGVYSEMIGTAASVFTRESNITILSGLSSDELISYSSQQEIQDIGNNNILVNSAIVQGTWNDLYNFIYSCNSIIEGVQLSTGVTDSLSSQLEGEAKFVRAWLYYFLVNFWGDVPLVLSTNYETNSLLPRVADSEVYNQIINDLEEARNLLPEGYSSNDKIRPNQAAANALLARIYLYQEDWVNSESQASLLIEDNRFSLETDLDNVFLNDSQEAIWQIQSINPDVGSYDALQFVLTFPPFGFGRSLRNDFVDAFEDGDNRAISWVGELVSGSNTFYYPFKFKTRFLADGETSNEYLTILRLAETYLIRAEARVQQGNISGAQEDLNAVRSRAGLAETTASDQASLLLAIEQERKVELFAELGHRWFDLRRTNRASVILSPLKAEWQDTDMLYPIPVAEFLNNPNLGNQNLGY